MRAWLSSPAVAFLSLLATVITLGQFVLSACRWAADLFREEDKGSRMYTAVIAAGSVALAVMAPLTWMTIYHVSEKLGQTHFEALLYPPMMLGTALCGLLTLSFANSWRRLARERLMPCALVLAGFGGVALIYLVSGGAIWERCLVSGVPGILMPMLTITLVMHAARSSRDSACIEGQSRPAG
jgi:ABC-type spermidine/putrescine transport system permease subunit II